MTDGPMTSEDLNRNAPRAWGLITAFATSNDAGADPTAAVDALIADLDDRDVAPLLYALCCQAGLLVTLAAQQIVTVVKETYRGVMAADGMVDTAAFDTFWRYTMEPTNNPTTVRDGILQSVGAEIPKINWLAADTGGDDDRKE